MGQAISTSHAVVLNCRDHGESDKIVTFFCQDIGLLTGIAKGANRSKKRFVNKLELFTHLLLSYQTNNRNNLVFIHSADHINSFLNLRCDVQLYSCASVIREFILLTSRDMSGDEGLYKLIVWSLQALNDNHDYRPILSIFLIRLLDLLGYRPNLSNCSVCMQPLVLEKTYRFHGSSGSIFCENCQDQSRSLLPLSHGTIRFLESARNLPLTQVHRLRPFSGNTRESFALLHRYVRQLFQKDIHSWKILAELNGH